MEVTPKSRLHIRIQNIVFLLLFLVLIGLLAFLSQRYKLEADLTATNRNTLSAASITLLQRMQQPIQITAFAREGNLIATRKNVNEFLKRYQKHKADIKLSFINPDTEPDKTREMGITVDGEMIVEYNGRSEHVQTLSEELFTNTLQQLMRRGEQKLVFITGHGERDPHGHANHDYGSFIKTLEAKGINASTLKLNETPEIPADTAVLVIAGPQVSYLPGEIKIIKDYLVRGGNLLWLHDPGKLYGLQVIAAELGISFQPGTIVDPTTQLLGVSDPSFALIADYSPHPITKNFKLMTVFPRAAGIDYQSIADAETTPFLQTVARSWSETGKMEGIIDFTQGKDIAGPLTIGLALSRPLKNVADNQADHTPSQRIIILGDGDFLANAYLGNQGNQDLGYNIINWLSHDDDFIAIASTTAPDTELVLDSLTWSFFGLFFLLGMPAVMLAAGIYIWLKRRKQ